MQSRVAALCVLLCVVDLISKVIQQCLEHVLTTKLHAQHQRRHTIAITPVQVSLDEVVSVEPSLEVLAKVADDALVELAVGLVVFERGVLIIQLLKHLLDLALVVGLAAHEADLAAHGAQNVERRLSLTVTR